MSYKYTTNWGSVTEYLDDEKLDADDVVEVKLQGVKHAVKLRYVKSTTISISDHGPAETIHQGWLGTYDVGTVTGKEFPVTLRELHELGAELSYVRDGFWKARQKEIRGK